MTAHQAQVLIEKLTMTQHPAWKPDYLQFEADFMALGFGQVTTHRSNAVAIPVGNSAIAVGGGRGTTRHVGDRVYYADVKDVRLLSWRRKLKQWYVVSVVTQRNQPVHVFRTRYLEDAQAYVDAFHAVLDERVNAAATLN